MRADELRSAVIKIVDILAQADLLAVVRDYRVAKGDERTVAAARLGHAGAVVMENMEQLSRAELTVVDTLHLRSLASTSYWQSLLESVNEPKIQAAELVNLYSRVMFATSHLPKLANTLALSNASEGFAPPESGQTRITIRLADAAEKASDPDRVARAIDAIDMLYSACASISRKPAMDLRLEGITGNPYREVTFTGGAEGVAAVIAVIESIPAAVSSGSQDENFNAVDVVNGLPIFQDLKTLAGLGTFDETELADISETMHQGVVLTLESGVEVYSREATARAERSANRVAAPAASAATIAGAVQPSVRSSSAAHTNGAVPPAAANQRAEPPTLTKRPSAHVPLKNGADTGSGGDEHYERYLREREAMQKGAPPEGVVGSEDQQRRDEVAALLKTLERDRNGK